MFKGPEEGLGPSASRAGWEASVEQMKSTVLYRTGMDSGIGWDGGKPCRTLKGKSQMPVKDLNLNSGMGKPQDYTVY